MKYLPTFPTEPLVVLSKHFTSLNKTQLSINTHIHLHTHTWFNVFSIKHLNLSNFMARQTSFAFYSIHSQLTKNWIETVDEEMIDWKRNDKNGLRQVYDVVELSVVKWKNKVRHIALIMSIDACDKRMASDNVQCISTSTCILVSVTRKTNSITWCYQPNVWTMVSQFNFIWNTWRRLILVLDSSLHSIFASTSI